MKNVLFIATGYKKRFYLIYTYSVVVLITLFSSSICASAITRFPHAEKLTINFEVAKEYSKFKEAFFLQFGDRLIERYNRFGSECDRMWDESFITRLKHFLLMGVLHSTISDRSRVSMITILSSGTCLPLWVNKTFSAFNVLHYAVRNNHLSDVAKFVSYFVPLQMLDNAGDSALHHASRLGFDDSAALLIDVEFFLNCKRYLNNELETINPSTLHFKNSNGRTPLGEALHNNQVTTGVVLLLKEALLYDEEVVNSLGIQKKNNMFNDSLCETLVFSIPQNILDLEGALNRVHRHHATILGESFQTAPLKAERLISLARETKFGETRLNNYFGTVLMGYIITVIIFSCAFGLIKEFCPHVIPRDIFIAIASNDEELCKKLLRMGIDLTKKNRQGETALELACKGASKSIVCLLLHHGAVVEKQHLILAIQKRNTETFTEMFKVLKNKQLPAAEFRDLKNQLRQIAIDNNEILNVLSEENDQNAPDLNNQPNNADAPQGQENHQNHYQDMPSEDELSEAHSDNEISDADAPQGQENPQNHSQVMPREDEVSEADSDNEINNLESFDGQENLNYLPLGESREIISYSSSSESFNDNVSQNPELFES